MSKLRRLSGRELIKILEELGFEVSSQSGSHLKLTRMINGQEQRVVVPVHSSKTLKTGTTKAIYNELLRFVPEGDLRRFFYTE